MSRCLLYDETAEYGLCQIVFCRTSAVVYFFMILHVLENFQIY